ncbi:MAG: hypothetical protein H0V79_10920 [Actinobacteria bacterium]|nr:hypothetical protein [Actinomycetota bacterium]
MLAVFAIIVALVLLLVWTSWRWGRPRLFIPPAIALWLLAALLAAILIWLALT